MSRCMVCLALTLCTSTAVLPCRGETAKVRQRPLPAREPSDSPGPTESARRGLDVPVLGWTASSAELRPIVGLRGAAALGWQATITGDVLHIDIAPSQSFAIVQRAGEPLAVVSLDQADASAPSPIAGAAAAPDTVAFSPTGSAALLYSRSDRHLEILTGFPLNPRVRWRTGLTAGTPEFKEFAVSDDGTTVLASQTDADAANLWVLSAGAEPRVLMPRLNAAVLKFLPRSSDAIVADAATHQVAIVKGTRGTGAIEVLAAAADGIGTPVDLLASSDGRHVFIAQSEGPGLLAIDRSDGQVAKISCRFAPSRLSALRDGKAIAVTEPAGLWLWDLPESVLRAVSVSRSN